MSHIHLNAVCVGADPQNPLFPPLSESISHEVVGLFGRNGCGKSTLLSAIASKRGLVSGSVTTDGAIGMMKQGAYSSGISVAQALAVADPLSILERIERGEAQGTDLDDADWDLPSRLEGMLSRVGLSDLALDRPANDLSGGQQCRVKIAALLIAQPDILLLDEPTNDLDDEGRAMVAQLLKDWGGPALVASHDRELLEGMDRIVELSPAGAVSVGGGWSTFKAQRDAIRERAKEALGQAERVARQARTAQQARTERHAQRSKQGRQGAARRDDSKLEINAQKDRAAKTLARNLAVGKDQVDHTIEALSKAAAQVERVVPVRIELPSSGLLSGHELVDVSAVCCEFGGEHVFGPLNLRITGPQRIALHGPNGSGKSSLLRIISGSLTPSAGFVRADQGAIAVLDQHLSLLGAQETALEAMRRHNSARNAQTAHAALAQYGFRSEWSQREVQTLSGGERVRLALACLFSAPEPPKLLILDEPTNHLDIHAVELLELALSEYDGAILCVSHDAEFRRALKLDKVINLTAEDRAHTDDLRN
ncbi:ABC-F family ATP-binding cassette domain-containing protein [Erythrobacter sp. KY5]|uniref:ABC-F family ATP-binding cassette domain-containing protein n=1 Tax=Erythrobacter sp. KY5 TaxID=2011159 RepID=UPI0013A70489|nr:ABC-F family ATP-binding cassette domain-containing protein [Erythrobacter sp. KY5]